MIVKIHTRSIQAFGEDVGQLIFSGYVPKINDFVLDQTPNVVMPDVNVLGSRMLNWILQDIDST